MEKTTSDNEKNNQIANSTKIRTSSLVPGVDNSQVIPSLPYIIKENSSTPEPGNVEFRKKI
jgi:hypothetical protein